MRRLLAEILRGRGSSVPWALSVPFMSKVNKSFSYICKKCEDYFVEQHIGERTVCKRNVLKGGTPMKGISFCSYQGEGV